MNTRKTLLTLAIAFASTPCLLAQVDPAKEPSPEILEKISTLQAAAKDRKFKRDAEAVRLIDELLSQHEQLHPKSQKKFLDALGTVFKGKKRKSDNMSLYIATAAALGEIGNSGSFKILEKAWGHKAFSKRKDWASLQDRMLESIGRTGEKKAMGLLLDEASDAHQDGIKVAAGRALRHFADHGFKVRKEIVKELVQAFTNVANGAKDSLNQSPAVETAKRTLRAISDPWNDTLAKLTGENFRTASEWRSWWNDYKNKPKKWKHQTEG